MTTVSKRYLILFILLSLALAALFIPVHDMQSKDLLMLSRFAKASDKVLLFGNSVNNAHSRCDTRADTIRDLVARRAGDGFIDMSKGGMSLEDMLHMAEVGTAGPIRPNTLIFPVSLSALFNTTLAPHGLPSFLRNNLGITGPQAPVQSLDITAANYEGKHFGGYADFAKTYFVNEKRHTTCPEQQGVDGEFLRYMYWRTYLQPTDPLLGFDGFIQRVDALKRKHINIVFWMPPVDYGDLRTWHGEQGVATVRGKLAAARQALEARGYPVIDTTDSVAAEDFIDRWCACGHMSLKGREIVADSLANFRQRQLAESASQAAKLQ